MAKTNVVFIGGPDSGKTNYLLRLWLAMRANHCGDFQIQNLPERLEYIESGMAYLYTGKFAERTSKDLSLESGSVTIPITVSQAGKEKSYDLFLPDVNGEMWKGVTETFEISQEWKDQFENSNGIVIFLRPSSEQIFQPLDWVTTGAIIESMGENPHANQIPTQVMLCEFLRILEHVFGGNGATLKSRISIVLTGWDAVSADNQAEGPNEYLRKQFPLFAGKLRHLEDFEVAVFASSVFGGDPESDPQLREKLQEYGLETSGYMIKDNSDGKLEETNNFFLPIEWALSFEDN